MSAVVCVARKPHPCPSYSRRRDRNNCVHWRSLDKGGYSKNTRTDINVGILTGQAGRTTPQCNVEMGCVTAMRNALSGQVAGVDGFEQGNGCQYFWGASRPLRKRGLHNMHFPSVTCPVHDSELPVPAAAVSTMRALVPCSCCPCCGPCCARHVPRAPHERTFPGPHSSSTPTRLPSGYQPFFVAQSLPTPMDVSADPSLDHGPSY